MRKLSDLRLQIRRITEWNVPELRARLEIDRDERTPRRRRARDAARTLHDPPAHHVRRAMHARVLIVEPRRVLTRLERVETVERYQLNECDVMIFWVVCVLLCGFFG